MNAHDEISDNEVLRAASRCLSALPVTNPPDLAAIMARGRTRRRHRLSALAGLSVAAAATALVLGLTGALGSAQAPGTIRTASFTLASNSNGTATLTINNADLLDPTVLQNDLQQDGIPAMVTSGSFCSSDPAPAGFSQVVSFYPATAGSHALPPGMHPHPTITFNPAAMPAGAELSFGVFQLSPGQQQADFALINTSSYTCTHTPPASTANGGSQVEFSPAGSQSGG